MSSLNSFDKMSSTSCSSMASNGAKYNMKQFTLAAQDYNKKKCDETASLISRYLQLLGVTQDLYTFDPHSSVTVQFIISLHELMENLEPQSNLIWCCINVLQHACKNPAMHKALINTYQFLPILSKLLGEYLTREKKIKLLTLMQELTYGIKISWQISHMPHLLQILIKWVESGDEPIVALSLSVLLNLCYKNIPVSFTLKQIVDPKHLYRTIIASKTPATAIYIHKLTIILENINGEVPDDNIILQFLTATFRTVIDAFKTNDLVRMRHILDIFMDVKGRGKHIQAMTNFNYQPEVLRIISEIETSINTDSPQIDNQNTTNECIGLILDFLNALLELKIIDLIPLHQKIVGLVLHYITNETVAPKALTILNTVINYPENISHDMLKIIVEKLPCFIQLLQNNFSQTLTLVEHYEKLGAILQLFRALVMCRDVRNKVVDQLSEDSIKELLKFMLNDEEVLKSVHIDEGVEFCMRALALVSELSQCDSYWYDIYQQIIKQRQIHVLLAKASFTESEPVKILLFEISRTNNFPKNEVASAMCSQLPSNHDGEILVNNKGVGDIGAFAVITNEQKKLLDKTIAIFQDVIANNQVANVSLSEVMELYEYKMASMAHTEQAYKSSLDSANKLVTHLHHKVAQMSIELSKLHQLLYQTQKCQEKARKELDAATDTIKKQEARLTKEEIRYKELTNTIKEKESELQEKQSQILHLENKQLEMSQAKKALSKKYEAQCEKNRSLVLGAEKLENEGRKLNKEIQEKNEMLSKCNFRIEQMTKEIRELEDLRKQHESTIVAKDKELQEALQNLAERQKILETITKLTTLRA